MGFQMPHDRNGRSYYMNNQHDDQHHHFGGEMMGHIGVEDIDPSLIDITYNPQNSISVFDFQQSFQASEQRPLQRYMAESDQMGPIRGSQMFQRSISNGVAIVPQASVRFNSPTPSSHGITISSSAASPVGENDLIYDSAMYSPLVGVYDFSGSFSQHNHFLHDLALQSDAAIPQYALPPKANPASYSCVNMSQVQGFADLQDFAYSIDEGYGGLSMQGGGNDYIEVSQHHLKAGDRDSYRYSTDEGLGTSIQDSASQHAASSPTDNEDGDAYGEAEDVPSPVSDDDYTPKSKASRFSTRKPHKRARDSDSPITPQPSTKRTRLNKNTKPGTQSYKSSNVGGVGTGRFHCTHCPDAFQSQSLLTKHTLKEHTKAFTCVFAFAGCTAIFATKNEWKRHVYSQHCNFHTWVCDIGECGKHSSSKAKTSGLVVVSASGSGGGAGASFNRKDLYTQHLRRMHTPKPVEKGGKNSPAAQQWEERIKVLQDENCHQTRGMPEELACPLLGCGQVFRGKNTWDDRMEHVGKHLEAVAHARSNAVGGVAAGRSGAVARGSGGNGGFGGIKDTGMGRDINTDVDQGSDALLVSWAVAEGVVVHDPSGEGYCFPSDLPRRNQELRADSTKLEEDSNDDAEGEDE